MQYTFIWLIVTILALLLESMTVTLTAIWFAAGGLLTLLLSFFIKNLYVQIVIFIIASTIALILTRPLIKNKITPKKVSTNYDMLIGEKAIVTEKIDPILGKGQINYKGQIWSAKAEKVIEINKTVIINSIRGVSAIVEESEEN